MIIIILHKAGNTWKTHMLLWWSVCSACYVEVKPYTARRPWQEQPLAANQRQHRSWWLFVAICICCLPVFLYETLRVFVLIPMFLPWLYVFACCTTSCCEYTHWHNNRKKKKKKKKHLPLNRHIYPLYTKENTHTPPHLHKQMHAHMTTTASSKRSCCCYLLKNTSNMETQIAFVWSVGDAVGAEDTCCFVWARSRIT